MYTCTHPFVTMNKRTKITNKGEKQRCLGRVMKGFDLWGTQRKPYLTTQCQRCAKPSGFCTSHEKLCNNQSGSSSKRLGAFGSSSTKICDISDTQYELIVKNPGIIDFNDFKKSKLTIHEYIDSRTKDMKRNELEKKMRQVISSLRDSRLEDVSSLLNEISDDIPSRHMTDSPQQRQETEAFLQKKHWWAQQDKVTIRDRFSHASTTFAKSSDGKFYTQNQVCVGEERYWSDPKVPEKYKNSDGIVLDPESHCYIYEIYLYPDAAKFHCLPKSSYCGFHFNISTGYLQKSHEISEETA